MTVAYQDFQVQMYQEHLDEGAFLYDQRQLYLHDIEVAWSELSPWEMRFEAHLDALVLGEFLALETCRQRVLDGDAEAGEWHTIVRLYCRHSRKDLVFELLRRLDLEDPEAVDSVADGLCLEMPPKWRQDLLTFAEQEQPGLCRLIARLLGYRRFRSECEQLRQLDWNTQGDCADLAWALGRTGSAGALSMLLEIFESSDHSVTRQLAAIALFRLDDHRSLPAILMAAPGNAWARAVASLAGNSQAVSVLIDATKSSTVDEDTVMGLGLLGDLRAVVPLLTLLAHDDLAESAAIALNTITGAELYEDVFIEDEPDVDELFDNESEVVNEVEDTAADDEARPGSWEHRPSTDSVRWRSWLEQNKQNFNRSKRWRLGKLYGPCALVDCLESHAPYSVRCATYEELVIRYGLDIPFEVNLPVGHQVSLIQRIRQWADNNESRFQPGGWYLGSQPQH